jgi:hypothetical protein
MNCLLEKALECLLLAQLPLQDKDLMDEKKLLKNLVIIEKKRIKRRI